MNCPACGHENREAAKFCEECGERFAKRCASELRSGAKFCDECGTPIARGEASALPERAPRDYTPKHLADKILQSKSVLEGERKQVTVLFADVKGSLELAEQIGSSFSRVYGHFAVGVAQALHGEWDDAVRACEAALQISNEHRTALEFESQILYQLAEAHLGAGDLRAAQASAEQGIRMARERGELFFEALNHLARARGLRHARGADARDEIERSLDRALELVEETNGRSIGPPLLEERARLAELLGDPEACERGLREAQRVHTKIGAGGHAQRLAEELRQ